MVRKILKSKESFEVETPGGEIRYPRGTTLRVKPTDKLDDEGWHIMWAREHYITVPRKLFEVLTVHTKIIKIETVINEAGDVVDSRVL